MDKIKEEDTMSSWEVCRICGENGIELVSIYDESGVTLQLEEKINHYLPITVSQEDELPLYMCIPCIEKLNTTHELIVICLEADEKLKELLQLKKKYLELNVSKLTKALPQKNNGVVYEEESLATDIAKELSDCDIKEEVVDDSLICISEMDLQIKEGQEEEEDKTYAELIVPKDENETPEEKDDNETSEEKDENETSEEVKEVVTECDDEEEIAAVLLVNGNDSEASSEKNHCKYCRQNFDDLSSHLQTCICEYCGTHFACPGTLYIHKLQHQREFHKCKVPGCSKRFVDKAKLEEHIALHNAEEPRLCDVCGRSFATSAHLRSHYRSHQEAPKEHTCTECPKQFRSRFHLRKHMMSHTGEKPFLCECCSKRFASKEALKQHLAIHSREKPYKCTMCAFSTIRRGNLAKHYETHADAKFECKVCHKTYATRYDLQTHHYTHSDEELNSIIELEGPGMLVCRTFRCDQCGKFLSSKASLVIHQRMHSGDRPFQCPQCGKCFSQKPSLDYHVRLHTGERPHQCAFCGQGFNSKAAKENHERVHTGEKPYRCPTCSARFRNCANLRQHQLIHNDSREHPCSVCGKRFRRREAVQVHMRVHTGERPYSCPLCFKKFTQKGDQLKHTRGHIMKNDRKCTFCCLEFPNRRELKQHKCEAKIIDDSQHFDTVLLNPTQLIANTEITVVTADVIDTA